MNKEKITRISSVALVACFGALLLGSAVTGFILTPEKYSFYENRNLAERPKPTVESVMDGSFFTDFDTYIKERSTAREGFVRLSTFLDLHVFHRPVVNGVVVTKKSLLQHYDYEVVSENNIEYYSSVITQNLQSHTDLVESYGGNFYYVAVPCQSVCKEDEYPWYLNSRSEYTVASRSALFSKLNAASVDYIDMLEYYEAEGRPDSYTSNIDNHYSILGGYATYREIIDKINADGKYDLDPLEEGEFEYREIDTRYLGSRTRKLFDMWNISEPLGVITPNVEVPFTRYNYGSLGSSTVYSIPKEGEKYVTYGLYMGGDITETVIETNRPELPSILVYGDSFTNAVESLIWYNFDTMYSLDFRYYNKKSLHEFIEEHKPEIVICVRDYNALLAPYGNGI